MAAKNKPYETVRPVHSVQETRGLMLSAISGAPHESTEMRSAPRLHFDV